MQILRFFALIILAAGCQTNDVDASETYSQREGIVRASAYTRNGPFQYVLEDGTSSSPVIYRYLITNFPDSLKNYAVNTNYGARIVFSGKTSPTLRPVLRPSNDETGEVDYELPTIRLTTVRRRF